MNTSKKMKLSIIALGALSSALMSANAAAACATGKTATITLNKTILATIAGGGRPGGVTLPVADASTGQALWGGVDYGKRYIYLNAFLADSAFSYSTLSNTVPATATGGTGVVAGTTTYTTQTLPVVCATSATPNYTTTFQTGNIVSTYNAGTGTGKIGLAGVFKVRSAFQNPSLSLRWGELSLEKIAGKWVVKDNLVAAMTGTPQTLFKLTEATETLSGTTVTLKGNLRFADASGPTDWGSCIKGTFSSTCNNGDPGDTIGSGANWWQGSSATYNNQTMLTGSGTYTTATSTKSGTPALYGTPRPTGSESQSLVGTIEVTYTY